MKAYQQIIRKELKVYETRRIDNAPDVKFHLVVSEDQTDFLLLSIGWRGKQFQNNVMFHFQIRGNKVWILKNNTDVEIGEILVEEGIPKSDIVIGWLPTYLQEMSDYGVG